MPPIDPNADPGARPARVPTRKRTFQHHVDPITAKRRPIFTWGNGILALVMILFGLYATGNLPQLDRFFDSLHNTLRAHNDVVVGNLMQFGPYIFLGFLLLIAGWFAFLRYNHSRRRVSDPSGWHKVVRAQPKVIRHIRREEDPPSLLKPLQKQTRFRKRIAQEEALKAAEKEAASQEPAKPAADSSPAEN